MAMLKRECTIEISKSDLFEIIEKAYNIKLDPQACFYVDGGEIYDDIMLEVAWSSEVEIGHD